MPNHAATNKRPRRSASKPTVRGGKPAQERKPARRANSRGTGKRILAADEPRAVRPAPEARELHCEPPHGSAAQEHYELVENEFDPGWLLFVALRAEMARQLDVATSDLRTNAMRELFEQIAGGPREEALPRALLAFTASSDEAIAVAANVAVLNQGATLRAVCASAVRRWSLGQISSIRGEFCGQGDIDLTARLRNGCEELGRWNAFALKRLKVVLVANDPGADERTLPGLVWDTPATIGCRVQGVRLAEHALDWRLDHAGRLFVPPQPVPSRAPQRTEIAVEVRLEPGELRHVGGLTANVAEYVVESCEPGAEFEIAPAGALHILESGSTSLEVRQPFDSSPGTPGESKEEWFSRVGRSFRHRDRTVTRQDYRDLVAEQFGDVVVLDVAPILVRRNQRDVDAVRVTICPRSTGSLGEYLERGTLVGHALSEYLSSRCPAGLPVVAGLPTVAVAALPQASDPLWLYRDLLLCQGQAGLEPQQRPDGSWWPVVDWSQLKGGPS